MKYKVLFVAGNKNIETYRELLLTDADVGFLPFHERPEPLPSCDADLIVLDCGLDFETGLSFLREHKKCCPEVIIVFLTATGSESTAVEAFRAGAREYFHKPVNFFELQETIENLLIVKGRVTEKRSPVQHPDMHGKSKTLHTTTSEKPLSLLRAVRYMEENLSRTITLAELAEESRLSMCHFCREFNRHFGASPMSYLTSIRIHRAKELLLRGDVTVSTVAYELGYDSPGTLIRNFKKTTGMTPSGYREKIRRRIPDA